jgi:predicted phage baseplate assembly protein
MAITPLNVDDRTFDDLVAEALQRIVAYTPEWTDFNESDPGITLVQLFAWLTETSLYRLNRVPDDRMYVSFINLVGFGQAPAVAATAIVEVQVAPGSGTVTVAPSDLRASAPGKTGDVVFEADAGVPLVGASIGVVLVDDGVSLARTDETANNTGGVSYQPFGPTKIPGRALYLGLDATPPAGPPLLVEPGNSAIVQLYVKADLPPAELAPASTSIAAGPVSLDGDLVWEGKTGGNTWTTLELVADETRALHQSGFVRLRLPDSLVQSKEPGDPDDKARFWIRARATSTTEETRAILYLFINGARLRQWQTYADELLQPGSDGTPNQARTVQHPPIMDDDQGQPVVVEVNQPGDGGGLVWTAWTKVDDLAARVLPGGTPVPTGSPAPVFKVGDDLASIVFGDGLDGLIPLRGVNNLRVTYRSGGGSQGNVGAGKLTLDSSLPNVNAIVQHEAAAGGADEESVDDEKRTAPDRLRALERAVTPADFETLAVQKAGVRRASAVNRWNPLVPGVPVTGCITLVVVPTPAGPDDHAPMPTQIFLGEVSSILEAYRVLTTELFVVPPNYRTVVVEVIVDVTVAGGGSVRGDVVSALETFFDPITGGVGGGGWPLGGTIAYGEVLTTVLATPHVAAVRSLTIVLDGVTQPSCQDVPLGTLDLVASGGHKVSVNLLSAQAKS